MNNLLKIIGISFIIVGLLFIFLNFVKVEEKPISDKNIVNYGILDKKIEIISDKVDKSQTKRGLLISDLKNKFKNCTTCDYYSKKLNYRL